MKTSSILAWVTPSSPTPEHIVDKLVETARRGDTHRYSQSRGVPRLRRAISNWYAERYDVSVDPENEAIVTIGSKEGLAHLAMATIGPGDAVLVPNPSYPIHPYGMVIAGEKSVMYRWSQMAISSARSFAPSRTRGRYPKCWC